MRRTLRRSVGPLTRGTTVGHTRRDDAVRPSVRPRRAAVPELPRGARAVPDDRPIPARTRSSRSACPRSSSRRSARSRTSPATSVSGVVAASLRRLVDEVEQARLDAALEADREENLEWARATAPMDAKPPRGRRVVGSGGRPNPRSRGDVHLVGFEDDRRLTSSAGRIRRSSSRRIACNRADGTVLVCSMTTKRAAVRRPDCAAPVPRPGSHVQRLGPRPRRIREVRPGVHAPGRHGSARGSGACDPSSDDARGRLAAVRARALTAGRLARRRRNPPSTMVPRISDARGRQR